MMSIREQAIALVDEFEHLKSDKISDDSYIEYPTAKLCALIAVDLVLTTIDSEDYISRAYWRSVKKEIEKL
ncbi:MAG: hypothetical protein RL308_3110 [Bacteroidota bacterium]|jgi:hypothetical protein